MRLPVLLVLPGPVPVGPPELVPVGLQGPVPVRLPGPKLMGPSVPVPVRLPGLGPVVVVGLALVPTGRRMPWPCPMVGVAAELAPRRVPSPGSSLVPVVGLLLPLMHGHERELGLRAEGGGVGPGPGAYPTVRLPRCGISSIRGWGVWAERWGVFHPWLWHPLGVGTGGSSPHGAGTGPLPFRGTRYGFGGRRVPPALRWSGVHCSA